MLFPTFLWAGRKQCLFICLLYLHVLYDSHVFNVFQLLLIILVDLSFE